MARPMKVSKKSSTTNVTLRRSKRIEQKRNNQQSHQAQRPQQARGSTNRLVDLPAELRNRVYELALVEFTAIKLSRPEIGEPAIGEPGLLRTCRQVRKEAIAVYYHNNKFFTLSRVALISWLRSIGASNRALLREVRNPGAYANFGTALRLLEGVELQLSQEGVPLPKNVYHQNVFSDTEQGFLNKASIVARMSDSDWEVHRGDIGTFG